MNSIDILTNLGLNTNQIQVYQALLQLGESKVGKICDKTKIPSSHIYPILAALQRQGLIVVSEKNKVRIYSANSPQILEKLFLEKEKELQMMKNPLQNLIEQLKKVKSDNSDSQIYNYFEGQRAIKAMWLQLNENMNPDKIVKFYTAVPENYENFIGFYNEHHKAQQKKRVRERLIFNKGDPEGKRRENMLTEVKYLSLKNTVEWGIVNNLFFFQYIVSKVPKALLVKDPLIVATFEQVFDQLWDAAKK